MTDARTGRLEIVSDAICPWCYIGKRRLDRALPRIAASGVRLSITWRAFQLNPAMPAAGMPRAAYRAAKFGSPARSAELDAQVTAAAADAGLALRLDRIARTPSTVDAHRLTALAARSGRQDALVERLFAAYFAGGQDISDHAVLLACADAAGLPHAEAAACLAGDEGRAEVLAEDAGFRAAGLSGVPTFILEGHVLFSGALPSDTMAEGITAAAKVLLA
ncbi:MAG: DsbA family oxidoreductase [Janthinobacterium lividum]